MCACRSSVAERSGQLVFEADDVSKAYGGAPVVRDFSTRIMRGDRIGLIGPNGAGKTTLLRLLVGELEPDTRRGPARRQRAGGVFRSAARAARSGADGRRYRGRRQRHRDGRRRHAPRHGYLEDFLFPPERARSPVKALSGGERNRLLLARLLTRPANVLMLDEPTNDLDIETLELLEAQLVDFPGTMLIVSHDRRF